MAPDGRHRILDDPVEQDALAGYLTGFVRRQARSVEPLVMQGALAAKRALEDSGVGRLLTWLHDEPPAKAVPAAKPRATVVTKVPPKPRKPRSPIHDAEWRDVG